jgi:hypothetical protein
MAKKNGSMEDVMSVTVSAMMTNPRTRSAYHSQDRVRKVEVQERLVQQRKYMKAISNEGNRGYMKPSKNS